MEEIVHSLWEQLEKLQAESLNQGGMFYFAHIPNPQQARAHQCLYDHLERLDMARAAAVATRKGRRQPQHYAYRKLALTAQVTDLNPVFERIMYWLYQSSPSNKRTEPTADFWPQWERFEEELQQLIATSGLIGVHEVLDNDAMQCMSVDHCNEDWVLETEQGLFIVHLGISS